MIVYADLLAILFMDSLFYGVLFPSNASTCADYSAQNGGTSEECLSQRSLWQGRDLCVWNDDDQTCDANPPPSNFEFFIIVAMLVSIFSMPLQAVMRYILAQIISKQTDFFKVVDILCVCFRWIEFLSCYGNRIRNKEYKNKITVPKNNSYDVYRRNKVFKRESNTVRSEHTWRDDVKTKYSFSDLLPVKEEVEILLTRVREILVQELQSSPLPWDLEASLSASEHRGRMDAIMAHLHLYADGTPMPLTWWQWLRHGSAVRHIERKLAVVRKREKMVLEAVQAVSTIEEKDAALVKYFILEQLPSWERYAVSIVYH